MKEKSVSTYQLDKTDVSIIKHLQNEGRMTNLQLSSEVGLSPAPTLERVRKLEGNGFIKGYHADVNEELLGFGVKCFIQITINLNVADARNKFIKEIANVKEIVECHHVTGSADFLVKLLAKDVKDYERIVLEKLSAIEAIGHQNSMMILSSTVSPIVPL